MTRNDRRSVLLLLLAAASVFAGGGLGCSQEPPAPQPVVRKALPKEPIKATEAPKPVEAAKEKTDAVAAYNPAGKRDPFVPFLRKEETKAITSVALEALPPLQRYDLNDLKFVGVIWGRKGARALVEDAGGKGYSVTVGTRIGRGGGVVTRITDGEIFVKEEFRDYTGSTVVRENSLKLQSAGGK